MNVKLLALIYHFRKNETAGISIYSRDTDPQKLNRHDITEDGAMLLIAFTINPSCFSHAV